MRLIGWMAVMVVAAACAPKGEPALVLEVFPKSVTDGTPVQVRAIGTSADGKIGMGTVRITAELGSLVDPVEVTLDGYGTARTEWVCDPGTEPGCADTTRITATWTSDKVDLTAEARLTAPTGGGAVGASSAGESRWASGKVLVLGTLQEGSCSLDALADPRRPTTVAVAFPCSVRGPKLHSGVLYYTQTSVPGLHRFREDSWDRVDGQARYPSPDKRRDDVLFASCGEIGGFRIAPGGNILHDCAARSTGFYFIDGVQSAIATSESVRAFGDQNSVLLSSAVLTSDGMRHSLSPSVYFTGPTLAVSGGYLGTTDTTAGCDLYRVMLDGSVTKEGSYPVRCGLALERDGTMLFTGYAGGNDTILEVPVNGMPSTIYTEADATPPDYSRYPPRVYVKMHGSELVGEN